MNDYVKPVFGANFDLSSLGTTLDVGVDGETTQLTGSFSLDLSPPTSVLFSGTSENPIGFLKFTAKAFKSPSVAINGSPNAAIVQKVERQTAYLSMQPAFVLKGSNETQLKRVVAHLFNFPRFTNPNAHIDYEGENEMQFLQFLTLAESNDPWKITITEIPKTTEPAASPEAKGGLALTHVVEIVKCDGSLFTVAEADERMLLLHSFLSFISGTITDLSLPVGFDENGNEAWIKCTVPSLAGASHRLFETSDDIEAFYKCFISKWKTGTWDKTLTLVIYWLCSAQQCKSYVLGIVAIQNALERFIFEIVKPQQGLRPVIRNPRRKDPTTAEKLICMLSHLNIHIDTNVIDSNLLLTPGANPPSEWACAPDAVTQFRNSVVHSNKKNLNFVEMNSRALIAFPLGLFLLEETILKACGYTGPYTKSLPKRW